MREYRKILRNREARIVRRLRRKQWCSQVKPMMSGGNIHYEMSGKAEAITCGGIGAFHHLVRRVGLVKEIDRHLHLLKVHLPCHESDHVLNIACNALVGGQRLEDIELRRQDATFLNALGAQRLPDPTTAGDFTRRFRPSDIETLMDCINRVRPGSGKSAPGANSKKPSSTSTAPWPPLSENASRAWPCHTTVSGDTILSWSLWRTPGRCCFL